MKYLLDTHILLWIIFTPRRLSQKMLKVLTNHENEIYLSAVSLWEISLKYSTGKLELKNFIPTDLVGIIRKMDFKIVDLTAKECSTFYELTGEYHKDPFDRILVWQAIQNKFIFITDDKFVKQYVSEGLEII